MSDSVVGVQARNTARQRWTGMSERRASGRVETLSHMLLCSRLKTALPSGGTVRIAVLLDRAQCRDVETPVSGGAFMVILCKMCKPL